MLIDYDYQNSFERAKKTALEDNKTLYTYILMADEMLGNSSSAEYSMEQFINRIADGNQTEILFGEYKNLREHILLGKAEKLESGQYIYSVMAQENQTKIQVISKYKAQYIINYYNISELLARRDQNYQLYRNIIIGISIVIAVVLYLFRGI